ncbi:hypothetical protein BDR22DRAFT_884285 [Usnea florida]
MSDLVIPTLTLSPRGHGSPPTTNAAETVYITDHVTVWSWSTTTETITESVIISSFIHVTTTATTTFTTQSPTTLTSTLTSTTTLPTSTIPITSSSTKPTSLIPTSTPTSTVCTAAHAHKPIDPYQVLTIVFGVLILILVAMMYWLVRRFYKMYRAERVLRKQLQTEGTEMPAMTMGGAGGEGR